MNEAEKRDADRRTEMTWEERALLVPRLELRAGSLQVCGEAVDEIRLLRSMLKRVVAQYDLQASVIMSAVEEAADYFRELHAAEADQ